MIFLFYLEIKACFTLCYGLVLQLTIFPIKLIYMRYKYGKMYTLLIYIFLNFIVEQGFSCNHSFCSQKVIQE